MPQAPKVSVILTSYNHAQNIRESIESVLNQTYSDFDFIIWDDGSTDESWEIIQEFSDPRIRSFRNKTDLRGSPIRSAFSEVLTKKYIAIHHSDDIWEPTKLEKQVVCLDINPQIGAAFTWARIIDEDGSPFLDKEHFYYKIFEQPNRTRHEWLNYFFYHGNALCHPSMLIRKKCYEDAGLYRYGLGQIGDFDMWIRLCLKYEIHVIPEKLVRFRIHLHEKNTSGNRPETHVRVHFELLHLYENYLKIKDADDFLKIFPDMQVFFSKEWYDLQFALAMVMLKPETNRIAKLFGLNILYSLLNDPTRAPILKEVYNFGHSEFVKLTAEQDVFSVKTIQDLNLQLQDLNLQLVEKELRVAELSSSLQAITQSRAWKLASRLKKTASVLRNFFSGNKL